MKITSIFLSEKNASMIKDELEKEFSDLIKVYVNDGNLTQLPHTDAYIGFGPILDFEAKNYKWIHCLAAGVDRFVNCENITKDVILTRTINPNVGFQIASYCLSYILAIENNLFTYFKHQQQNDWNRKAKKENFKGKKVVIFGTGNIGSEIAKLLIGIGFNVVGISKSGKKRENFDEVYKVDECYQVISDARWIINIMPLTTDTTDFFDYEFFSKLQQASFINVGRGLSVIEEDLIRALEEGFLEYAILDVQRVEPLPKDSKLWNNKNIFITPHISGLPDFEASSRSIPIILRKIINQEELDCIVDLTKEY